MADDPNKFDDDEYQFSETEDLETQEDIEPRERTGGSPTMRRNAVIAIGLIVVVLAVYKLMGMFFEPTSVNQTKETAIVPSTTLTAKTITTQQPVAITPAVQQTSPSFPDTANVSSRVDQKLSQLEISAESTKSDINNLNSSVSELKSGLSDLTNKIAELNVTIANLTTEVQQQQQKLLLIKVKKPKVAKVMVIKKRWSGYFIQALIRGRAWLKSANGATITVGKGSRIPGFGVVTVIDPRRGVVITSSGEVIRFSPNDR